MGLGKPLDAKGFVDLIRAGVEPGNTQSAIADIDSVANRHTIKLPAAVDLLTSGRRVRLVVFLPAIHGDLTRVQCVE